MNGDEGDKSIEINTILPMNGYEIISQIQWLVGAAQFAAQTRSRAWTRGAIMSRSMEQKAIRR